jgi:hypothetical protein
MQLRVLYRGEAGGPEIFLAYAAMIARNYPALASVSRSRMMAALEESGAVDQAEALGRQILEEGSEYSRYILYRLLKLALRRDDESTAKVYLSQLESLSSRSAMTRHAEYLCQVPVDKDVAFKTVPDANITDIATVQEDLSLEKKSVIPDHTFLGANYPNPFNPTTTIQFGLKNAGMVKIRIYDVLGREIATLVNEQLPAGMHQVVWNGSMQSSGIYFVRMEATGFVETRKLFLLK